MRFFKGLGLFIFSLIVFTLSVVMILIGLEVVKIEAVASLIPFCFGSQTASIITYSVCGVLVVLSLICLFGKSSKSKKKEEQDKGILLANSDGQLLITKQTIENIVSGVVANTNTIYDARSSVMIDNANNVSVKVYATVVEGALIKDVSSKLQTDIKNAIKSATDLEVTTVDVAISNNVNGNGGYAAPVAAPVVNEPVNTPVVEAPVVETPTYVEPIPAPVYEEQQVVETQAPVEQTYEETSIPVDDPDVPTMEEIKAEAAREAAEVDAIIASETAKAEKTTRTRKTTTRKTTAKKATTPKKTAAKKTTAKKATTAKKTTTRKTTKK
jgi:uncharacterized alkaline shock family protein YloU